MVVSKQVNEIVDRPYTAIVHHKVVLVIHRYYKVVYRYFSERLPRVKG